MFSVTFVVHEPGNWFPGDGTAGGRHVSKDEWKRSKRGDPGLFNRGEIPLDLHTLARKAFAQNDWEAAARFFSQCEEQRSAELALDQQRPGGAHRPLEMQAIYNLVGDKLRETFDAQVVMISQYDPQINRVYHHYAIERGHLNLTPRPWIAPACASCRPANPT